MPDITEQELDDILSTVRIAIWNNVRKFEKDVADADMLRLIAAYREVRDTQKQYEEKLLDDQGLLADYQQTTLRLRTELAQWQDFDMKRVRQIDQLETQLAHYTTHNHEPCMYCDPLRTQLAEARAELEGLKPRLLEILRVQDCCDCDLDYVGCQLTQIRKLMDACR